MMSAENQLNLIVSGGEDEQLCVRGQLKERYVPVSFVAKSLSVSPRRVRALLVADRLSGRRLDNGYWEVLYPFNFVVGTRGPCLQVFQPKPFVVKSGRSNDPKLHGYRLSSDGFWKLEAKKPRQAIHQTKEEYQESLLLPWPFETQEQYAERIGKIN